MKAGVQSIRRVWSLLRHPVPAEKKRLLAQRWAELPPHLHEAGQGFGRQATGCGATIGIMPRCDFDCQGCYLGQDANAMARQPLPEALRQVDALREFLGPKGNLQVTDGEVTLLPEDDLLAILRHAREVGLIPMLMTHGDTFRREPALLPRLVAEGGLSEVSIHVDSLQRGRRGRHGEARSERELMELRDELADLVRAVRRETGCPLRAATTMTVSRDNLPEVADVVRWTFANRDAFGLISFQPLAQVGRTREDQTGIDPGTLWAAIGEALAPFGFDGGRRTPLQLGHPDCTRMEPLLVYEADGQDPRVLQIVRPGREDDAALVEGFFERDLGGVNFRDDAPLERIARGTGLFLRAPGWFLGPVRRWAAERAAEAGTSLPRLAGRALAGRARLGSFLVVSHHFMDATELATARGRERLSACVFRVPIDGEMVPMCRTNATDLRDAFYRRPQGERREPALPVIAAGPAAGATAGTPAPAPDIG